MLEIGQVWEQLLTQGYVCVVDDYEEKAVRLVMKSSDVEAYLKRKGRKEVKTPYSYDTVQCIIHELNNHELTKEEYENY